MKYAKNIYIKFVSNPFRMRIAVALLLACFLMSFTTWQTDFEKAKQSAKTEHKFILLNFSGSDWCGPCIRLKNEIFESDTFKRFAEAQLVLVNADFPRLKKNRLPKEQQKNNNRIADLYNSEGAFPLTVLLDENGNVIRKWDGIPSEKAQDFINEIKKSINAAR